MTLIETRSRKNNELIRSEVYVSQRDWRERALEPGQFLPPRDVIKHSHAIWKTEKAGQYKATRRDYVSGGGNGSGMEAIYKAQGATDKQVLDHKQRDKRSRQGGFWFRLLGGRT